MAKIALCLSFFCGAIFALFPFTGHALTLYGGDPFYFDERESVSKRIFRDPNPIGGDYTYEYPITLPPGRNGLQPGLSFVYSSNDRSNISPFGYGWSINIPYIERVPRYGSDDLYNGVATSNIFYSSLDGEIRASSTSAGTEDFGPLVENGDFRKYEYKDNMWWQVTDKRGMMYTFGVNAVGRQNNPNVATSTYKWMLEEIRDRNNNYIKYTYTKDKGQIYPSTVIYTGNGGTDGIYEIAFTKESRSDIATSTLPGFPVVSNYRISEIRVKVNGSWVRKYELDYTTGDNGVRSLLDTITETGRDESLNTLTLPVTNFDYTFHSNTASSTWTSDGNYTIDQPFVHYGEDYGVRFVDVNGDSLPDLLFGLGGETRRVYINDGDGTGWTEDGDYVLPANFYDIQDHYDCGTRLADVNGDGYADILRSFFYSGATTTAVWINDGDGTGWTEDASYTIPIAFIVRDAGGFYDQGVRIVDIDGDGLPDLAQSKDSSYGVYINDGDGTGWTKDENYTVPEDIVKDDKDTGVRFEDINGDGLVDFLRAQDGYNHYVYINNGDGTGWTKDNNYSIPEDFVTYANNLDVGLRLADINNDGFPDLIKSYQLLGGSGEVRVYLNNGNGTGWTQNTKYEIPAYFVINVTPETLQETGVRLFDVDGDGSLDFLTASTSPYAVQINDNAVAKTDFLSHIITYIGGEITINYTTTALANPKSPINFDVVGSVGRNNGFGLIATTTYTHEGGEYYYDDEYDRKFAGFATTTKTDPFGNVTKTYFHQGNGSQTTIGEYSDDVSKIGKAYRAEIYDNNNNLYKKSITKWENVALANNRDYVKASQVVSFDYDGDADHKDSAVAYSYDDGTGNLTQRIDYGETVGSDDGTFTDNGTDKRTTTIGYAHHGTCYVPGLPSIETTKNNDNTTVVEKKYYYDELAYCLVDEGNPTKEERWVESSTYVDTERTYNNYGLVTQTKDQRDKTTTYVYESNNLFVGTTTDPLSNITETYRDLSSGKVTKLVDPNGRSFETDYDALDRVVTEKIPDHLGTPSSAVTKTTYSYTDTVGSRRVYRVDYLSSATSTDIYTYYDGFDNAIQKRIEAEDSNTYVVTDTAYDENGQVGTSSLPYFDTGSSRGTATTTSGLLIVYTYDPLGRAKTIVNTEGTENYGYDQWIKTVTDRESNEKNFTTDAFGNLVVVDEHLDASTSTTRYNYDALNNLTQITDGLDNVRNFTYDGLSRLTKAEDIHDSADTTFASTTYAYDDSGNITTKIGMEDQTVNYTYDDINRVLTEDYTDSAGTEIEYGYDWCAEGKTRLCSATTTDSVTNLAYDALGNVISENKEVDNTAYTTTNNYDRLGNQTKIVYPDGLTVFYNHNSAGLLETVGVQKVGSTTPELVIKDLDYGPHGNVTYRRYGNNIGGTYTYDANELYRLKKIDTK